MDIGNEKARLRTAIRRRRRELDEWQREYAAGAVAKRLLNIPELINAKLLLSYMPMRDELDITPAVSKLREKGVLVAYPLCADEGGLRLFIPAGEDGFTIGAYGVREPRIETSIEIKANELDAIILPAVGFDRKCNRLGQGGGYYDRLLAKTDCFTVAVGFDCQLVDQTPLEATDKAVDAVVIPSGVFKRVW